MNKDGETELDLDENVAGALCYILTWLTGIVFYLVEKKNKFVRFHAMQSIVTFLPLTIIGYFFGMMAPLWMIGNLIWLAVLLLWLFLMFKAYQGEKYKLPIAGNIAENQIK